MVQVRLCMRMKRQYHHLPQEQLFKLLFDTNGTISGTTALVVGLHTTRAIAMLSGDQILANDTITGTLVMGNPLSGNYTIGALKLYYVVKRIE